MNLRVLVSLVFVFFFTGCATKKKEAELLEQNKPMWLKERPVNSSFYYGIGITPKIGSPMLYEDKAKERALADISSQINSTVSSEAILYQVEDKNGIREYLQNRIKSTSAQFLEGYEYVDKWEDPSNVYVFYQLSKKIYLELKAKRKAEAIQSASEKYVAGVQFLKDKRHVNAMEHFAFCIDILSGYMNESTTTLLNGKSVDLISESKGELTAMIRDLRVKECDPMLIDGMNNPCVMVYSNDNSRVSNLPVKFKYSGGYLVNELAKTNDKGIVLFPDLPKANNAESHTLSVEVDLVNLGRHVTKNLFVRKVIEQQKAAKAVLDIR